MLFKDENLAIINFYLRCDDSENNDEVLGSLRAYIEFLLRKYCGIKLILCGDANREDVACNNTIGKVLTEIELPFFTHETKRNGEVVLRTNLYKVFVHNLQIETK